MNVMKKMIIFLVLFLLISFSTSIAAENNWKLNHKLDHKAVRGENAAELWENFGSSSFIETALVYNRVNLGGPILKSYDRFAKNYKVEDHNKNKEYQEKNKSFYPFAEYIKIIYNGFDSNNNIHLKIYKSYTSNEEYMYKYINSLVDTTESESNEKEFEDEMKRLNIKNMDKMKEIYVKSSLLDGEFVFEFEDDYQEYIVAADKEIIFEDDLIPNFIINTNPDDSTISIQIID
jgi:hypothetical protein